jgi:nucleotide-binding universal stress UspA family protein
MGSQAVNRKVAIAVDLSDESAYAVRWAVANYLRPSDTVILLHVQPTSILYGADWGSMEQSVDFGDNKEAQQQSFDDLTSSKASDLAKPIREANIPFKIHIVKDHDMKERICLEVERLGVNAVIMGSRGFGAVKKSHKARLGSVSDYCVHHCDCPVVVVRFPDEEKQDPGHQRLQEQETIIEEEGEEGHEEGEEEGKKKKKKDEEELKDPSLKEVVSQEEAYENGIAKKIKADVEA